MIATHNQQATQEKNSPTLPSDIASHHESDALSKIKNFTPTQQLLPHSVISHHPRAGVNPLVDACSYLFSVLGQLKQIKTHRNLGQFQASLIQEINRFQDVIKSHGYHTEYVIVCRYIICAVFDDIISDTPWGGHGQWHDYSLLTAFNQDRQHHDKFFSILERAMKEPTLYIDLMELIYITLSMGYKGRYRATEYSHYQLEQITNNLYMHIRAYRGSFSKILSPVPIKHLKTVIQPHEQPSHPFLFAIVITASAIMTIFVSLGYLMDIISNEAFKNSIQIETPVSTQL